jgi:hypothetical protein
MAEILFLLILVVTLTQYWLTGRTRDGEHGR